MQEFMSEFKWITFHLDKAFSASDPEGTNPEPQDLICCHGVVVEVCFIVGLQRDGTLPQTFHRKFSFWEILPIFLAKIYKQQLKCSWGGVYATMQQDSSVTREAWEASLTFFFETQDHKMCDYIRVLTSVKCSYSFCQYNTNLLLFCQSSRYKCLHTVCTDRDNNKKNETFRVYVRARSVFGWAQWENCSTCLMSCVLDVV